jgi:hypothetical protein
LNTGSAGTTILTQACFTAKSAFCKGHRIMVQVQSSWFPVYDGNPQSWVPNIFEARPGDFQAATQKVYRTAGYPSPVEVLVVDHP